MLHVRAVTSWLAAYRLNWRTSTPSQRPQGQGIGSDCLHALRRQDMQELRAALNSVEVAWQEAALKRSRNDDR